MSGSTLSKSLPRAAETPAEPREFLPVAGLTPFTTIDYPGRLSAVIFTQGCAWKCGYCHNAHLRSFEARESLPWDKVFGFLSKRRYYLEAVVFSGGEPTAHSGLFEAMAQVRQMGFLIGLHSTGMYPERFREVLPLCDWVGMDIKAPFGDYHKVTGRDDCGLKVKESLSYLLESKVAYECRTTIHSTLLTEADLRRLGVELAEAGVGSFVLQKFRPEGCAESSLAETDETPVVFPEELRQFFSGMFPLFQTRGFLNDDAIFDRKMIDKESR